MLVSLLKSIYFTLYSSIYKRWPLFVYPKEEFWILKEFNQNIAFIREKPFRGFRVKKLLNYMQKVHLRYYLPVTGDIIIDVGAGNGDEVLVYSQLVGRRGKVYAIEAHPKTYNNLKRSVEFNRTDNIYCYQLAISNKEGTLYINNSESWYANKITDSDQNSSKVRSTSMDLFVKENRIDHIDFLQINIEGAEEEAIEEMRDTLTVTKNIAISCHDFLSGTQTNRIHEKVKGILLDQGFELFYNDTGIAYRDSWIFGKK